MLQILLFCIKKIQLPERATQNLDAKARLIINVWTVKRLAFSLVEMLMALLVASLLMAALAPVMTKRINENMHITANFSQDTRSEIREIRFGDPNFCNRIVRDSNNNNPLYCEGEYIVPAGFKNITVTAIGGGGGGGTAPTAGYTEFTGAGSTSNFIVPTMVNQLEATLIGGGASGGAGGQVKKTEKFTTVGLNTFNVPEALKNRAGSVTMCGAGGRGGMPYNNICWGSDAVYGSQGSGAGGSGGFYKNKIVTFAGDATVQVYVGGAGESPAYMWIDPGDFFTNRVIYPERNGVTAEDGSGGRGGITNNEFVQNGKGGNGGHSAGGTGGKVYGWCGYVGGGGGGGGASRLCSAGQSCYLYTGGGGGGGGAGVWVNGSPFAVLSGGAGGGGGGTGVGGGGGDANNRNRGCNSGGGGGGLPGGNGGGGGGCDTTVGGVGGVSPLSEYSNYCRGGDVSKEPGNGIVTVTYLDYGPGASGGGAAHIVPLQKVSVTPAETLGVKIGRGIEGSKAGKINSDGTIKEPGILTTWDDKTATITKITRGATSILATPGHNAGKGLSGGSYTGEVLGLSIGPFYAGHGWMTNGVEPFSASYQSGFNGFYVTNGRTAGNTDFVGSKTYAAKTSGGDGGKVTTPWFECTPGKGARTAGNSSYIGGNAAGYGCGGGGGYALSDGGNGSGGYARISWNMYWNSALNGGGGAYDYAEIGAGGGGAGGNVVIETIRVIEGQVIKIRIGAGGAGAKVINNQIVPANSGGATIFGDVNFVEIKAGGGGAGGSSVISGSTIVNGRGGEISRVCDAGAHRYIDNTNHCKKGNPGENAYKNGNKSLGGRGADFLYDKYTGTGGLGGIQDTGENSNGKNAVTTGISAGGGGAAIRIFNSATPLSGVLNNPNRGGDGAPGMMILKLWE